MIGGGVLQECLEHPEIEEVLAVGRRGPGLVHPKLRELILSDLFDLQTSAGELTGYDACYYCLGVSAAGLSEAAYRRITHDLTMVVAQVLVQANPAIKFCFISGQGADSSGKGRIMWARVKGQTENELLALPIEVYVFRPGIIRPLKGVRSRTTAYRVLYTVTAPVLPLIERLFPGQVTNSIKLAQAMILATTKGCDRRILETRHINDLAATAAAP